MKITAISDSHGQYGDLKLTGGDLLIHAGDSCRQSSPNNEKDFMEWFDKQPYYNKVFVPGNHDFSYSHPEILKYFREKYPRITILLDDRVVIDGITIYGTPWTLPFYDWCFMADEYKMAEVCAKIPHNTDILVTHGPSYNILDRTNDDCNAGSKSQADRILELGNLKYHIFGHIHETYGMEKHGGVTHYNASVLDVRYQMVNTPHDFVLE